MTFLAPLLLWGLPLAALPVIVHLLNLRRHRRVDWGAMQFLLQATQQRRGATRLRHLLILAARVAAIVALVMLISRPMAGRWFGWFGGRPQTVIIILDRSPSMAQQDLQSGQSKRAMAIERLSSAIRSAGLPQFLVLIEGSGAPPQVLSEPEALQEIPEAGATDASANLPAMLQQALDYIVANQSGRTDVWVCSDMQLTDWQIDSGSWSAVRSGFEELRQPVRFHLLTYTQPAPENLATRVTGLRREQRGNSDQLSLDVEITRSRATSSRTIPLEIVVDGARSVVECEVSGDVTLLTNHRVSIDRQRQQGWGKIELPADENPRDSVYYFAYGDAVRQRATLVSDEPGSIWPLRLSVAPPQEVPSAEAQVLSRADFVSWQPRSTSLLIWQAPLPTGDAARSLEAFVETGGYVMVFPTSVDDTATFLNLSWGDWRELPADQQQAIDQWRDDSGLLAHTDAGEPLPVNRVTVHDYRAIRGPGQVLARLRSGDPLLLRVPTERGGVYFFATLPQEPHSNLARQGVVFFAMMQRALQAGTERLLASQFGEIDPSAQAQRDVDGVTALVDEQHVVGWPEGRFSTQARRVAGIYQHDEQLVARNRPVGEDRWVTVDRDQLARLMSGLNYRVVEDTVVGGRALVTEIWRVFGIVVLLMLLAEGLLCLPDVRPRTLVPA